MKADILNGIEQTGKVSGQVMGIVFCGLFVYGAVALTKDAIIAKRKLRKHDKAAEKLEAVIS